MARRRLFKVTVAVVGATTCFAAASLLQKDDEKEEKRQQRLQIMAAQSMEAKREKLFTAFQELNVGLKLKVPETAGELTTWLQAYCKRSKTDEEEFKIVKDAIHGHIKLHPLCVAIMDTPQFQRLRDIKQLGGVCYVYPSGSHSRFEHSIGVYHLAGKLARALKERQPELYITDKDVLCVEIAGLCHDLGHGPFSHVFDMTFIQGHFGKELEHEDASCKLIDHMLETETGLSKKFKDYDLREKDIEFIKALIKGKKGDKDDGGRQAEKCFLYEIVANKRNGVDVDKWDYFLRDCHHLGMHTDFDHERMINSARVIKAGEKGKEEQQICWRDKDKFNARELFHARYALHKRVYQHRVVKTVELMIVDAMAKVNKILAVTGENGKKQPLTESTDDMEAYSKLTDSIFYQILNFDETQLENEDEKKQLREAQELLKNVQRRKLYRCIEAGGPTEEELPDKEQIKDQIIQKMQKMRQEALKDRIRVMIAKFDMGKAEKNKMYFYPKNSPDTATPGDLQQVKEQFVRVYLVPSGDKKADEESYNDIKEAFEKWCVQNRIGTDRDATV